MTRQEIMPHLEGGKKITHESFKPKEFLKLKNGEVVDEKGKIYIDAFFNHKFWQEGWSVLETENQPQP